MKKLLFFILLSSNQMLTAEGDDSARRSALPADEPLAKRQKLEDLEQSGFCGRRRKPLQYLVKVEGDEHSYLCNHKSCPGTVIKFKTRDTAVSHDKDHRAKDSKKFSCEKGCDNIFFARDAERKSHYQCWHKEGTVSRPVKKVDLIKMAQNQEAYKKWIKHDEQGVLLCGHPNCSQKKFDLISSLHRHIRGHVASDNGDYPCERGCPDTFFARNTQREIHYKKRHPVDDPEAVEDMQEEFDLSSFVGRKVKRFACIYTFCSQHGELFSREDMVKHCQQEHEMQEQDIELDDFKI